ncbi:MAG: hypothetical protein U0894_13810 [Pirellulales bacterium]
MSVTQATSAPQATMTAAEILAREFLEIRCRILDVAAALDRLQRAPGTAEDPRLARILEGLKIAQSTDPNRAEQVQLLFSRPYEGAWQETMKVRAPAP